MVMSALSGISEWRKLLFLALFLVAGVFLFSILGSIAILAIYGMDVMVNVSQSIYTPQSIDALKWLQAIQSFGLFAGPAVLLAYLFSNSPWKYLGYFKTSGTNCLVAIAAILVAFPAINLFSSVNELIPLSDWMLSQEINAEMLLNAFLTHTTLPGFLVNVLIISILPAFGEEMIFRGLIQKHFIKITRNVGWGIVIAAVIFSAFHLQFKGFIPRFMLGVLLGYLYVKGGSIWLPIVAHSVNNFVSILVFTLMDKGCIGNQFEEIGTLGNMWVLGIASVALVVLLVTKIKGPDNSCADEAMAQQANI